MSAEMNNKWDWTDAVIQEFSEFVRADGCRVIDIHRSLSGQCTFQLTVPIGSTVTADGLMDSFVRHKNTQTSLLPSV